MAIYRGPGGPGDATADSANTAQLAEEFALDAANSATAAANSATAASNAATAAETSETNAGVSETNAANSAGAAATSATNASNSATSAASSASAASTSATNAADSATTAAASQAAAATSETNAANSAGAAATSETNAAASASTASTAATNAATSETAAAASASAAATSETNAASSASAASTSASNASTSETNAAASASAAATSESNAATSASNAATSASNAATSETNAAASASAASTSASNAATSETNAAASASAALTSETNAAASESAAATSETNAANSAAAAATSASNAATSESNAATSASNAATSETNASNSASAASTSESNAATSESNAATSESNAATSASNAATSETNAAASESAALAAQAAAESVYDDFDDRYLGDKASDPTLDNDGNALLTGALYWNTTSSELKVYNGSSWSTLGGGAAGITDDTTTNATRYLTFADATSGTFSTAYVSSSKLTYNPSTGVIGGSISGNAGTATALQTARTIGGVSFNGTANINLPGVNTAGNQNTSGNAATATALQTARTINGTSFNGTANITITAVNPSTLTRGSYLTGSNYNGSAATTWAVDATTAATASKIVARNGSGDDYRRYGFGQYFNMSHSATTRSSDTVFYSSTDNYIRKNNSTGMRASLNVPTRTGGNASGTWAISITGNAATATKLSTAGGSAPSYSARAWIRFNTFSNNNILGSANVSSITDNGTGDIRINFSTAMPNANYSVNGVPGNRSSTYLTSINVANHLTAPTTSNVRIQLMVKVTGSSANNPVDCDHNSVSIIG